MRGNSRMQNVDGMDDIRERWEEKAEQLLSALTHIYRCPDEPWECGDPEHALATRLVNEADL